MLLEAVGSILSFTPVIGFAALGLLIGQKSGVWNIGIEGIMGMGTFAGIFGYYFLGQSIWISLLFGFFVGVIFGLVLSILCIHFSMNQVVVGFGLWFLGEGLAGFLYFMTLPPFAKVRETFPTFLSLDLIFYLTVVLFVILYILLKKTKQGLAIMVAGERPEAGDCAGINIYKVRWICTFIGAGMMGLAGAYLSVGILKGFTYTMLAGYGWIAFAIVLFGRFSVSGTLFGTLLFTFLIGTQTRLQVAGVTFIPPEFMVVLPHIGVIVVLTLAAIMGKRAGMPSALGVHYKRE